MHELKISVLITTICVLIIHIKCLNEQNFDNSSETLSTNNSIDYISYDIENGADQENEFNLNKLITNELQMEENQNLSISQKFVNSFIKIKKISNIVLKQMTPIIMDMIYELNVSAECLSGLAKASRAISDNQEWVHKMLDANGRFPSGIMSGTITSLGDYDQCLSVHSKQYEIRGKYCLLKVRPPLPMKKKVITFKDRLFNLNGTVLQNTWIEDNIVQHLYPFYYYYVINGICVPSTCHQNDIKMFSSKIFSPFNLNTEIDNCVTESDTNIKLNKGQIFALIIILSFVFISLLSTIFDSLTKIMNINQNHLFIKIIQSLSALRNTQKLFDFATKTNEFHSCDLRFINGLKVISIIWIIIGHTYISGGILFTKEIPAPNLYLDNLKDAIDLPKQFITQIIINAIFAVDTFFFISGLLIVCITISKIKEKKYKLNFFSFLFLRWMRFIPALIGVICIHLLWPTLGSGPFFHSKYINVLTDPCYYGWWKNILFISNWFPLQKQCLIHTWYLSADFQYYIIAFFLLIIISYDNKSGTYAALGLTFLGIIIPTFIAYINKFPPAILYQADIEDMAQKSSSMHYQTYNHLSPYFFGTFIGCLLLNEHKYNLKSIFRYIIWIITILGSITVLLLTYIWSNLEWEYSRITASLYFGFHRFIWISGIAWIAFNCANNKGGIINSILTSKIFIITSRLTFSIYLSHMIIIWYNFFRTEHLFNASHYDMLFQASGVYGFTLIMAFFCHIIFEAPIDNLVKLIIGLKSDKTCINVNEHKIHL